MEKSNTYMNPDGKLFTQDMFGKLVSEDEVIRILQAFAQANGRVPTEDEAVAIIRWAERVRLDETLLSMTLKNVIGPVNVAEGVEPSFQLTPGGRDLADRTFGSNPSM